MTQIFDNDEKAYLDWLQKNSGGFVLNSRRDIDQTYMVLHRSGCYYISRYNDMSRPGGFTERSFIKICSTDINDLRAWVRAHGRLDGSFSKECSKCNR